jgi:hypothetical protein
MDCGFSDIHLPDQGHDCQACRPSDLYQFVETQHQFFAVRVEEDHGFSESSEKAIMAMHFSRKEDRQRSQHAGRKAVGLSGQLRPLGGLMAQQACTIPIVEHAKPQS